MKRAELVLAALVSLFAGAALLPHGVAADGECGKVKCGMGACSESGDYVFGFACQCNPGWSRFHLGSMQFPFLPCVIPNSCLLQYCGDGGACEKASDFTHRCICRDGFANLLNDTSFPCYRQCSLGSDCKGLGIDVINGSAPGMAPPAPVSFTIKKSGAGASSAPAERLLVLFMLISIWVQGI
ncbi:hypothetical protein ACP4OV_028534 [Aristida adscensionis]